MNYYPPAGFHFLVEFNISGQSEDVRFQEVAGLTVQMQTEELAEGGQLRFAHKLPLRTQYDNLVLKRGLVLNSNLIKWCQNAIENFTFQPSNLMVKLLNEAHQPIGVWNVVHAYPVKWSISAFNAEKSELAIETLELCYHYFNYRPV